MYVNFTSFVFGVAKNLFTDSLVPLQEIMKMLNASIFSFIILKLVKKGILDFHVTAATDMCMKEVIDSCLRRVLWRRIMETLKAIIWTIILLNSVSKGLSFYYTVIFVGPSVSHRTLPYKQFVDSLLDGSSRPEVLLKISQN